jgi:hypothetical protein
MTLERQALRNPNLYREYDVDIHFSQEELACIQKALVGWPEWITIEKLLQMWARFVAEVEGGYGESIYEYLNDLAARDVLNAVADAVPEGLRIKLLELIRETDRRFFEATDDVHRCIDGRGTCDEWWRRVPKKLTETLREDFQDWGVQGDTDAPEM